VGRVHIVIALTMSLDLTVLDKGLARFLENDLILAFHAGIGLEEFENAANVLFSNWPVLGGKLNFLVSDSSHFFHPAWDMDTHRFYSEPR
jgi:hypothetical protein